MKTLAKILLVVGVLVLLVWAFQRPFADRSRRADSFAGYVKEGQTIAQVFAGPREWDGLWVECNEAGKPVRTVSILRRENDYLARSFDRSAEKSYPNLDALVADLSSGAGPFTGRSTINLAYKYYMVSGTFVLTLSPDGRVTNVKRVSRG